VKILGQGDLAKKLTVSAHGFSKSAREKIEAAGGKVVWLRGEPVPKVKKERKRPAPVADSDDEPVEETPESAAEPGAEPEAVAEPQAEASEDADG